MDIDDLATTLRVINLVACVGAGLLIFFLMLAYLQQAQQKRYHLVYAFCGFFTADAIGLAEYNSVGKQFSNSILFFSGCLIIFYIGAAMHLRYLFTHWSQRRGSDEF